MTKKSSNQIMSHKEELINSIEPNFIFSKKPLNRFKFNEIKNENRNLNKIEQINELKKLIKSVEKISELIKRPKQISPVEIIRLHGETNNKQNYKF